VSDTKGFAQGWEKEQRAGSKEETGGGVRHQRLRAGVEERGKSRKQRAVSKDETGGGVRHQRLRAGGGRKSKEQEAERRRAAVSVTKGFAQGWEKEQRAGSKEEMGGGVSHQRLRARVGERAKRRWAAVSVIKGFARGWEKE
jgi:hypothetical protein